MRVGWSSVRAAARTLPVSFITFVVMFVADAFQLLCFVHHHCLLQTLLRGVVWEYVYALYLKVLLCS